MINNFFIVGTGRIGSLSLARTLNAIPNVNATHEKFLNARILSNRRWDGKDTGESLSDSVRRSYDAFKSRTGSVSLDSNCLVWNIVDIIDKLDEVGYIYIVRDRQQTVDSMMRTGFYTKSYPWELRAQRGFFNPFDDDYTEADRRKNAEHVYNIRNGQIEEAFKGIDEGRILRLDFADMVADSEQYMNRITNFMESLSGLKLNNNGSLLHLHKTGK